MMMMMMMMILIILLILGCNKLNLWGRSSSPPVPGELNMKKGNQKEVNNTALKRVLPGGIGRDAMGFDFSFCKVHFLPMFSMKITGGGKIISN